jgi:hypothetical protein
MVANNVTAVAMQLLRRHAEATTGSYSHACILFEVPLNSYYTMATGKSAT